MPPRFRLPTLVLTASLALAATAHAQLAVNLDDGDDWLATGNASRNNGGLPVALQNSANGVTLTGANTNFVAGNTVTTLAQFIDGDTADAGSGTENEEWVNPANANGALFAAASPSSRLFGGTKYTVSLNGTLAINSTAGAVAGIQAGSAAGTGTIRDNIRSGISANIGAATAGTFHTGTIQSAFVWKKDDFLNGYNAASPLDASLGSLSVTGYGYLGNGGLETPTFFIATTARFIVQVGGTYYASATEFDLDDRRGGFVQADDGYAGSTATSGSLGAQSWLPITFSTLSSDTTPLATLGLPAAISLGDVTAVGVLLSSTFSTPQGTFQQRITDFEFNVVPEPSTTALLTSTAALGTLLALRRRRG